jgi:hypothetical protein
MVIATTLSMMWETYVTLEFVGGRRILMILLQYEVNDYTDPSIVKDDLQSLQGQIAWLARNMNEGKEHAVRIKEDLEHLWVEFLQERRYFRHLIEEHLGSPSANH